MSLADAVAVLERGGVVVFPTETVWGLGSRLDRPDGIARIYELKGREAGKPLQVMVATAAELASVAVPDDRARTLADRFLPGPLSLVLPAPAGGTVAVRVPDHPVASALLARTGPVAATSANRSGEPTPDSLDEIRQVFGDAVDVYLDDGGVPPGRTASTLVDLTGPDAAVLRAGAVSEAEVASVLTGARW